MNIVHDNGRYYIFNRAEIKGALRPKNYSFEYCSKGSCFLEESAEFKIPEVFHAIDDKLIRHVISAYRSGRDKGLGVLLQGSKGQGKSVTAKVLCMQLGLPVVMINKPIPKHVDFVTFLTSIEQDVVVFVDEFEKIFSIYDGESQDPHSQESFLSLMDGSLSDGVGRKVFIFTANSEVNDKFLNRPSRIRYYRKYDFLDKSVYDAIISQELVNKDFEKDLRKEVSQHSCSIDLLREIISEINLHNEPYSKFKEFFNFREKITSYDRYVKIKEAWVFDRVFSMAKIGPESAIYDDNRMPCRITAINEAGEIFFSGVDGKDKLKYYKLVPRNEGMYL